MGGENGRQYQVRNENITSTGTEGGRGKGGYFDRAIRESFFEEVTIEA